MDKLLKTKRDPKKSRHITRKGAYINRFNNPLEETKYLEVFQKLLIEKLILNKQKKFCQINMDRAAEAILNRQANINLKIKGGLLLCCNIEAEEFVLFQETNKRMFGEYVPIDQVLQLLISWYICYYHPNNKNKNLLPLKKRENRTRYDKIKSFENRFKKYYKNII